MILVLISVTATSATLFVHGARYTQYCILHFIIFALFFNLCVVMLYTFVFIYWYRYPVSPKKLCHFYFCNLWFLSTDFNNFFTLTNRNDQHTYLE